MNTERLREFIAVARLGSITLAAKQIGISQSLLSRRIKSLESDWGVKLFERSVSGVSPTPATLHFVDKAAHILLEAERLEGAAREAGAAAGQALHIGFTSSVMAHQIWNALERLKEDFPNIRPTLHELTPGAQTSALRKGTLDVALIGQACKAHQQEFALEYLHTLPLAIVMNSCHPLAQREDISMADLRDAEFCSYLVETHPSNQEYLTDHCRKAGFDPKITHRVDGTAAMLGVIAAIPKCMGMVPVSVQLLVHPGVKFVPIREGLTVIAEAALKHQEDRPHVLRFLEILKKTEARFIVPQHSALC